MAMAPPTAPPPSFYDNLPAGADAAGGGPAKPGAGAGADEPDTDEEVIKGLTGAFRVMSKVAKLKPNLKAGIDKIKEDIKTLFVTGLKKDPKDLDLGEEKPPASKEPPAGGSAASPSQTDESHAA